MISSRDSFSIDISLRHPNRDPLSIARALSIKPQGFQPAIEDLDTAQEKWTFFYGRLEIGDPTISYADALQNTVNFVRQHAAFWRQFTLENGEVKIILNHTIHLQDANGDLCFDLFLSPAFMAHLCEHGVGLNVKGWQVRSKRNKFGRPKS